MKTFGHIRPVRDDKGAVIGHKESPARAVTAGKLGHNHGSDSDRRLVVSLVAGDLIQFRPYGTQRTYQIGAVSAFEWILRSFAQARQLEKAREKKSRKAQRLANERQLRAEKRLFKKEAA